MLSYNLKEVALRLKSLRDLMGVSVQEMAKATDVKESEYEIYENFLRRQAFASQQIPEKSFVRMCYVHILWHLEIFDSVHSCHKFIC